MNLQVGIRYFQNVYQLAGRFERTRSALTMLIGPTRPSAQAGS